MKCENCENELIYDTDGENDWYYCNCTPNKSYYIADIVKRCEKADTENVALKFNLNNIQKKYKKLLVAIDNIDSQINFAKEAVK